MDTFVSEGSFLGLPLPFFTSGAESSESSSNFLTFVSFFADFGTAFSDILILTQAKLKPPRQSKAYLCKPFKRQRLYNICFREALLIYKHLSDFLKKLNQVVQNKKFNEKLHFN